MLYDAVRGPFRTLRDVYDAGERGGSDSIRAGAQWLADSVIGAIEQDDIYVPDMNKDNVIRLIIGKLQQIDTQLTASPMKEPKVHLTPEIYERFKEYHEENPAWGSLHIVLDDANLEDSHVEFCVQWAEQRGDFEGAALARLLLRLSKTQRGRISKRV